MPGTKVGMLKARATMIAKLGGEAAYKAWLMENSRKGGANGRGPGYKGGFAAGQDGRIRASVYGRVGGARSRRKAKEEL